MDRRTFIKSALVGSAAALTAQADEAATAAPSSQAPVSHWRGNPIAVSTYSFWRFGVGKKLTMVECIDHAAIMGFDAVELLEVQIEHAEPGKKKSNAYLQSLKRRAAVNGLDICGLSTHQGFVSPDKQKRRRNIDKTIASIELCYKLGIPIMRVNTGTWGTSKNFDELMKNRGIEKPLEGYTDEDAYPWVIESLEKCLPTAEKCGVTLGLENHWGLGRTPEGVLRIVNALGSPWLAVLMDTGNFLEEPYDKLAKLAPRAVFVQAKTYFGGGVWYTLDLDYQRIARLLRAANYHGYVSLEFEGRAPGAEAIPQSLQLLRRTFGA